jgi:hypothetical protein
LGPHPTTICGHPPVILYTLHAMEAPDQAEIPPPGISAPLLCRILGTR